MSNRYLTLLVSSARYPDDPQNLMSLKGAQADAWLVLNALTDARRGLFTAADVTVLQDPTSAEFLDTVRDVSDRAGADDTVLFY